MVEVGTSSTPSRPEHEQKHALSLGSLITGKETSPPLRPLGAE